MNLTNFKLCMVIGSSKSYSMVPVVITGLHLRSQSYYKARMSLFHIFQNSQSIQTKFGMLLKHFGLLAHVIFFALVFFVFVYVI